MQKLEAQATATPHISFPTPSRNQIWIKVPLLAPTAVSLVLVLTILWGYVLPPNPSPNDPKPSPNKKFDAGETSLHQNRDLFASNLLSLLIKEGQKQSSNQQSHKEAWTLPNRV